MLDGVSLDQLRTFIAAADEGSFSAAGRRLRRAQSVVSQVLAKLEGQLGVKLFDRSARFPVLTDQGRALLASARVVAGDVDLFKARAKSLAGRLEPELSVAVDVMFPLAPFTSAVADFQKEFTATLLKFDIESSAVVEPVLDGRCIIGVSGMGPWSIVPPQLTQEPLLNIRTPMVVSPQHPLARCGSTVPTTVFAEHIQLVHADPANLSRSATGVLSPRVWRLSHLGAKLAFLHAGLGFGIMPLHLVEADLASGALVQITAKDAPPEGYAVAMSAIYRTNSPPGPAGRWFIDRLKHGVQPFKQTVSRPPYRSARPRRPGDRSAVRSRRVSGVVDSTNGPAGI
jgi:DNA-binding transcriptional LysR family regulator